MKTIIQLLLIVTVLLACSQTETTKGALKTSIMHKQINPELPTIGILIFEGFLSNEIVAPIDVFSKGDTEGNALFNVLLIAKENKPYISEEGLQVLPDRLISDVPQLKVLVVPSSFSPEKQVSDSALIQFIRSQNETADFIASHCAGAFMLGQSGVADNQKIVTYVGGGSALQEDYPNLKVQDDEAVDFILDGKIFSSNGSLVSYPASLALLEKLTSTEQRLHVENELLYHKLKLR